MAEVMATWIDAVITAPVLALMAALFWRAAEALRRRGVVVRPISMMDALMSKVEKQLAEKQRERARIFRLPGKVPKISEAFRCSTVGGPSARHP